MRARGGLIDADVIRPISGQIGSLVARIRWPLTLGAVLSGVGGGLVGYCPGPDSSLAWSWQSGDRTVCRCTGNRNGDLQRLGRIIQSRAEARLSGLNFLGADDPAAHLDNDGIEAGVCVGSAMQN
jgi:hypothetical protein